MCSMRLIAARVIAILSLPLVAFAGSMNLEATITYREWIALPPDAVLEIELLDTSRAEGPWVCMSSRRFRLDGVQKTVQIHYDASLIDERLAASS